MKTRIIYKETEPNILKSTSYFNDYVSVMDLNTMTGYILNASTQSIVSTVKSSSKTVLMRLLKKELIKLGIEFTPEKFTGDKHWKNREASETNS